METRSVRFIVCGVIVLMLLAATPLRAQWEYEIDPKRVERRSWYGGLAEIGGGLSQHGGFMNIEIMSFGIHWPKPFGVAGTVMEIIDHPGREGTIGSLLPLGIYFPILTHYGTRETKIWNGFMNFTTRAYLLNYEIHNNKLFPVFLDVCLEWRSQFALATHTVINAGYRLQIRPSEYGKERLDMSGAFVGLQVVVMSGAWWGWF